MRDQSSLAIRRLVWKTTPFLLEDFTNPKNAENSFIAFTPTENGTGFPIIQGVWRVDDILVSYDGKRMIVVDVAKKELLRVDGVGLRGVKHDQILDLNVDGKRWEGDVLNGNPYGWGRLYNGDGRLVYEGFRIGTVNVCYGFGYYGNGGVIEYKGELCGGKRWGRGTYYDRNGGVQYDGEWMDDDHMEESVELKEGREWIHNHINALKVRDGCCNGEQWKELKWNWMPFLKSLKVGKECFTNVEAFDLSGVSDLVSVVIGENSFTNAKAFDLSGVSDLKSVVIGDECFTNADSFRITGVGKLESVAIGKNSFTKEKDWKGNEPTRHFCVKDCPSLKELKMGHHSFSDYSECKIENVDALEAIAFGDVNEASYNFPYASLGLRSLLVRSE